MKQPENLSIGMILANRYPLRVPKYQRSYAWQSDEIDDFVSDLRSIIEAEESGTPRAHFLGGIVSVENTVPASKTGRVYDLVDGQQRMATFFLLLSLVIAAYDRIIEIAKREGDDLTATKAASSRDVDSSEYLFYEEVNAATGVKMKLQRLQLSAADAHYFRGLVEGTDADPERESHRCLRYAWKRISKDLIQPCFSGDELTAAERWNRLQGLLKAVREHCLVVHISSDERDEAYRLFMTLNNRGLRLSEGELLRAWTLERLDGHDQDQVQVERAWDAILASKPEVVDSFLRDYFASFEGRRASKRTLFDDFVQKFFQFPSKPSTEQRKEMVAQILAMRKEHEVYLRLSDSDWPYENPAALAWEQDRLDRLVSVLGRNVVLPLFMAAFAELTEAQFTEIVDYVEKADFRYMVCGGHAGQLGDRYYQQAKIIRNKHMDYDTSGLKEAVRALAAGSATDEVFSAQLAAQMTYAPKGGGNKKLAHFLTTVDAYYASIKKDGKKPPRPEKLTVYDLKHLDIEHVYAQTAEIIEPALEPLKHDLGNLTFWGPEDNRSQSNKPFVQKRPSYEQSLVALTREIAESEAWDDTKVADRRARLIKAALRVFTF